MTPEQHLQRIRQLEFMLEKADYGMGMPRDYERVLALREMIEEEKAVLRVKMLGEELDAITSDGVE